MPNINGNEVAIVGGITLFENNLYVNGSIIDFPAQGEQILARKPLVIVAEEGDEWHLVKMTDRIDVIAWKHWGEVVADASKYWWVIADANNVYNPFDLSSYVGKYILVPDILRIRLLL